MPIALLGSIGFTVAMMYPNNDAIIIVTCVIYGAAGLAAYPIACELTVETTYPVGEATSTGIFVMLGQLLAGKMRNLDYSIEMAITFNGNLQDWFQINDN